MLLVEGPAGIGKSSLLAEARVMAGRVGVRALFGEASESREAVPFTALLDATLGSDPPIGERESVQLLSEQPYWMLHELQGALEAAALEQPLACSRRDQAGRSHPDTAPVGAGEGQRSRTPSSARPSTQRSRGNWDRRPTPMRRQGACCDRWRR